METMNTDSSWSLFKAIFTIFLFFLCYLGIGYILTFLYYFLVGGGINEKIFSFLIPTSPIITVVFLCLLVVEFTQNTIKRSETKDVWIKMPLSSWFFTMITIPIWLNIGSIFLGFFGLNKISIILFNYRFAFMKYSILLSVGISIIYLLLPTKRESSNIV